MGGAGGDAQPASKERPLSAGASTAAVKKSSPLRNVSALGGEGGTGVAPLVPVPLPQSVAGAVDWAALGGSGGGKQGRSNSDVGQRACVSRIRMMRLL